MAKVVYKCLGITSNMQEGWLSEPTTPIHSIFQVLPKKETWASALSGLG